MGSSPLPAWFNPSSWAGKPCRSGETPVRGFGQLPIRIQSTRPPGQTETPSVRGRWLLEGARRGRTLVVAKGRHPAASPVCVERADCCTADTAKHAGSMVRPTVMARLRQGKKVRIVVDEDGTTNPPELPLATVRRRLVGTDRQEYYLVELAHPVECLRALPDGTTSKWTLRELVISPTFVGGSLGRPLGFLRHGAFNTLAIANVLDPPLKSEGLLDFSKVVYCARGRMLRK